MVSPGPWPPDSPVMSVIIKGLGHWISVPTHGDLETEIIPPNFSERMEAKGQPKRQHVIKLQLKL